MLPTRKMMLYIFLKLQGSLAQHPWALRELERSHGRMVRAAVSVPLTLAGSPAHLLPTSTHLWALGFLLLISILIPHQFAPDEFPLSD